MVILWNSFGRTMAYQKITHLAQKFASEEPSNWGSFLKIDFESPIENATSISFPLLVKNDDNNWARLTFTTTEIIHYGKCTREDPTYKAFGIKTPLVKSDFSSLYFDRKVKETVFKAGIDHDSIDPEHCDLTVWTLWKLDTFIEYTVSEMVNNGLISAAGGRRQAAGAKPVIKVKSTRFKSLVHTIAGRDEVVVPNPWLIMPISKKQGSDGQFNVPKFHDSTPAHIDEFAQLPFVEKHIDQKIRSRTRVVAQCNATTVRFNEYGYGVALYFQSLHIRRMPQQDAGEIVEFRDDENENDVGDSISVVAASDRSEMSACRSIGPNNLALFNNKGARIPPTPVIGGTMEE